ncbi:MAG: CDP-alcohol phosphatidyltransferase family protein [Caldilineaceae bacterium]|nr:CDP-alcohol phosphatidyltransferase family protein [Caldilineaceae bacterium]
MLSKYGRQLVAMPVAKLVAWLRALGVTPNALTYSGFVLTVVSAFVLANGYFVWGGLLLLVAAIFDLLDGSLARATDQSSTFGAFIDSTLDRYAESVTFLALAFYYSTQPDARTPLVLLFVIMVGSLMVSYTRARAEGLQVECKAGILQRPERVLLLIFGLLSGWVVPVLWLLAVLTNFTAFQRIYEVYWRTAGQAARSPNSKMVKTEN